MGGSMDFRRPLRGVGTSVLLLVFSFFSCVSSASQLQQASPLSAVAIVTTSLEFPFTPDSEKTTGSLCSASNPDFERYRYEERIPYCGRNVDREMKDKVYDAYGVPRGCRKDYTIDHFIPLSIGGTNSFNNLWPEHKSIKFLRQNLENDLYKQISKGEISQAEAVRIVTEAKLNPVVSRPGDFEFCH